MDSSSTDIVIHDLDDDTLSSLSVLRNSIWRPICLPYIHFQLYSLIKWSEKAFSCVYDHYSLSKVKNEAQLVFGQLTA